ncbi:hypothetical protein QSJ18_18340 [Gordonia sp. ABSL1-1]|uniref:hypothetical protein n=1 Tax=Gordonia sp. ABSL1-1 TaxID=3053923 RepID=UPI0025742BD2|nr:hypothetical protein [Gordonia sp. ABSL1-1]MDL9938710.1 hypothetical protein [Gordonia sp. ABSL1-1]
MSNTEITQADNDSLSILPPAQPRQSTSVAQLMEHAQAMGTAYELADKMCRTQLVPQIYRQKPEDGTAAILYGAELGLTPIQSLQQIFVVHGSPAIYARTMVALLKRRGYKIWTESSTDEAVSVMGSAPDGTAEMSTWTIERATRAGYVPTIDERTGKYKLNGNGKLIGNEKYLTDPQAMLYAKAAAEVCRRLAPEVLLGIAIDDEMNDEDAPTRVASTSVQQQAPGVADLRERMGLAAANPAVAEAEPVVEAEVTADPEPAAEAEETSDEPETVPDEPRATDAQTRKLAILLTEEGLTERAAKIDYLTETFGREFKSSKELTKSEASELIEFLSKSRAEAEAKGGDQ